MFKEGNAFFTVASRAVLAASVGLSACAPRRTASGRSLDENSCREGWSPARLFLHSIPITDQYYRFEGIVSGFEHPTTGRWGLLVVYPGGAEFIPIPLDDPGWVNLGLEPGADTFYVYQLGGENPYSGAYGGRGIFCYALVEGEQDPLPDPLEDWRYSDSPATV